VRVRVCVSVRVGDDERVAFLKDKKKKQ